MGPEWLQFNILIVWNKNGFNDMLTGIPLKLVSLMGQWQLYIEFNPTLIELNSITEVNLWNGTSMDSMLYWMESISEVTLFMEHHSIHHIYWMESHCSQYIEWWDINEFNVILNRLQLTQFIEPDINGFIVSIEWNPWDIIVKFKGIPLK